MDGRIRILKLAALVLAIPLCFVASAPARAQGAAEKAGELSVEKIFRSRQFSPNLALGVEWAPDSRRASYFHRTNGGMELMARDAATGEEHVLLPADKISSVLLPEKEKHSQATGLGRATPESYHWAPDSSALLFTGGGHLVWLDLKTMSAKHLLDSEKDIEDVKICPDGKWVSYVQDANLWVTSVATGEAHPVTTGGSEELLKGKLDWVYPEELNNQTAYWWSPDSTHLAYFEMDERAVTRYPIIQYDTPNSAVEMTRYPQAGEANPIVRVGVVSVAGGQTTWMETGNNTDVYIARVDWLPDSKQLAIQRLNRAQNHLDLLLADASSGASHTILREDDKYWINISDDLTFLEGGKRFLWSSERSGYRHLYVCDISGKQVAQLTSGDWAVTGVYGFGPRARGLAVDEKRGYVYFLSNKDSLVENQLYRVSLADKSVTRITKEKGSHSVTIAPDTSVLVDTWSSSTEPPRQELERADGSAIAALSNGKICALAEYRLTGPEYFTVPANDGTRLQAMMIKPPNFDASKRYPVIIRVYGGPGAQLVRNAWGGSAFLWDEMMAQKGYVIFALDNRGSYNRGHAFETPIARHFGKLELEDQLAGVRYLKSLPYVDEARIGIWGWSYGGYMTLMAMFHAADMFKAGVSVAPVTDWHFYDTIYTERYMSRPQDNPDGYRDSSPASFAANLKGKLMVIHGTGDDNVHFSNTAKLLNNLIDAGQYPEVLIFPGRGHGISDPPALYQVFKHIQDFFLSNL